jgi:hypothetical protein
MADPSRFPATPRDAVTNRQEGHPGAAPITTARRTRNPLRFSTHHERQAPLDCHAHTTWSDGQLDLDTMLDAVRAAAACDRRSPTMSRATGRAIDSPERLEAYLDALETRETGGPRSTAGTMGSGARFRRHSTIASRTRSDRCTPSGSPTVRCSGSSLGNGPRLTAHDYVEALVDNLERLAARCRSTSWPI